MLLLFYHFIYFETFIFFNKILLRIKMSSFPDQDGSTKTFNKQADKAMM